MSLGQSFIFGAGYSGKAFAQANAGSGNTIFGTSRSVEKFDALRQAGIAPLVFDGASTPEIEAALRDTTHLVVSIAPDVTGDLVLNAMRETIETSMPALGWIA